MTTYCFADTVASKVISYFKTCPPNGKPKSTAEAASEFTVLASIVATRKRSDALGDSPTEMTVISIATGTKCAGKCREDVDGCILSDSHAEVLARRGLVRWLLKCLIAAQKDISICTQDSFPLCLVSSIESDKGLTNVTQVAYFQIKGEWDFHLYISDSPCGDATIYTRKVNEGCIAGFTGAKLVRSESNREQLDKGLSTTACMTDDRAPTANICNWEREDIQEIGAVRTKSGRSDVQVQNRTTSMSCSDKICRYKTAISSNFP
jgi:tRNA-specific adenosine deaminase 1